MGLENSSTPVLSCLGALVVLASVPCAAQPAPAHGALLVTCSGPCQVRVDGQDIGAAPAIAQGLLPGQHLVEAVGPNGASFRGVAEVTAGRSTAFAVELSTSAAAPPGATRAPPPVRSEGAVQVAPPSPVGARQVAPPGATPFAAIAPGHVTAQAQAETQDAPAPVGPVPPPTDHELGVLTPPPRDWNGGISSNPGVGIALIVVGGLALTAGGITLIYAASLHQSHPDRGVFEGLGGGLLVLGPLSIAGGILSMIFMKGAGPADQSGTVYFAGVEPVLNVSGEGALIGGRLRW